MTIADLAEIPALRNIKDQCRWTLSMCFEDDKKPGKLKKIPMDIVKWLRRECFYTYPAPCWSKDKSLSEQFLTLTEMAADPDLCQWAGNACLFLNQRAGDDIVILDIEPDCPENEKADFLALPWLYAEKSVSGKGLHLVFPAPESFPEIRCGKHALKPQKRNDYEILLNHQVTFSLNPISHDPDRPVRPMSDFLELWESLAKTAKLHEARKLELGELPDTSKIPEFQRIMAAMSDTFIKKKPADYGNDMSRFEYAVAIDLGRRLEALLSLPVFRSHAYSDEEKLMLLFTALKDRLPYREKHDETRDGLPWLCYQAKSALAFITTPTKKEGTT